VKKDEFIYVSNINVLSTVQRRIDELLKKIWQRERERERERAFKKCHFYQNTSFKYSFKRFKYRALQN